MSEAQWRVFGLLLAIGGLELAFSPATRDYLRGVSKAASTGNASSLGDLLRGAQQTDMSLILLWVISALILIAITDVAPSVGQWIALLVFVGVVLARGGEIASWINATSSYLNSTRNGKGGGITK